MSKEREETNKMIMAMFNQYARVYKKLDCFYSSAKILKQLDFGGKFSMPDYCHHGSNAGLMSQKSNRVKQSDLHYTEANFKSAKVLFLTFICTLIL